MLKTDQDLDGVPLSYIDMMERTESEERRREREKQIMREGKELWQKKKQEEEELLFRDLEELKELSRAKMFGRPGHGAPTRDIRKKKFTEHQMNSLTRSQSLFGLDMTDSEVTAASPVARYDSQPAIDQAVSKQQSCYLYTAFALWQLVEGETFSSGQCQGCYGVKLDVFYSNYLQQSGKFSV